MALAVCCTMNSCSLPVLPGRAPLLDFGPVHWQHSRCLFGSSSSSRIAVMEPPGTTHTSKFRGWRGLFVCPPSPSSSASSRFFSLHQRPLLSLGSWGTLHSRTTAASPAPHSNTCTMALRSEVGDAVQESRLWDKMNVEEAEESLEPVDPEFYRMGYMRYVRAYGVEFKEGPKGIGVYAAKDMTIVKTGRVIMEIPMELMITVSKELPWMFHPDIVPIGHPIFEIINSTDPEMDWDLRLACLLLLALDQKENFWQEYSDYLPGHADLTCLLLATEDELLELHDKELEQVLTFQKARAFNFWKQNWTADAILKVKRLARDPSQFLWALGVVWSRKFLMTMTIGSKVQDAHMLIPYADMLNHSYQPTCSYRWRKKDRMLEVVMNPGQTIKQGDEMTLNYSHSKPSDMYMQFYGFSSAKNPFDVVKFSGDARIHRDSFLSAFNLSGMTDDIYYAGPEEDADGFVDGAVLAAARTLPTWSDEDLPFLPSQEIRAARELKHECQKILENFPTTLEEDYHVYDSGAERNPRWQAAVKYRMNRKRLIGRIIQTLDLYMQRILF